MEKEKVDEKKNNKALATNVLLWSSEHLCWNPVYAGLWFGKNKYTVLYNVFFYRELRFEIFHQTNIIDIKLYVHSFFR